MYDVTKNNIVPSTLCTESLKHSLLKSNRDITKLYLETLLNEILLWQDTFRIVIADGKNFVQRYAICLYKLKGAA